MNENSWLAHRVAPLVLAALVFLVMLPIAATLVIQYPDEFHYHDAGALMLESGDWLTPKTADGGTRLKKPIIPYWTSAAGMAVGGLGVAESRMFHLLLAVGTVVLVFALARALNCDRITALLAATIYAGNFLVLDAAYKAGPDSSLMFFLTLSALGFVHLLTGRGRARLWQWVAYLGLALAINSKGLLPVVFFGFIVAFTYTWPGLRARAGRIFSPAPMAVGFALAIGWFAYQGAVNGTALFEQFLGDQITRRAQFVPTSMGASLVKYVSLYLLSFLPWTAVLAAAAVFRRRSALRFSVDMDTALVLGWTTVVVLIFSSSSRTDLRYALPTFPFVAVLIAAAIANLNQDWLIRVIQWIVLGFIIVYGLIIAFLALAFAQLTSIIGSLVYLLAFGAIMALCYWLAFRKAQRRATFVMACAPLVVLASLSPVLLTMALPHPLEIAATVLKARQSDPQATLFIGPMRYASTLRFYRPGLRDSRRLDGEDLARFDHIVTRNTAVANQLRDRGFEVTEERGGWGWEASAAVFGAVLRGEFRQAVRDHAATVFVANRPGALNPPDAEGQDLSQ
jgi:4-amino-4-deoxy-L-arabinose transferase-like glycosyltransferase